MLWERSARTRRASLAGMGGRQGCSLFRRSRSSKELRRGCRQALGSCRLHKVPKDFAGGGGGKGIAKLEDAGNFVRGRDAAGRAGASLRPRLPRTGREE